VNNEGFVEDSIRYYPNMFLLLTKLFFKKEGRFPLIVNSKDNLIYPDWVAGMFMLFESNSFMTLQGFDESFFMYYEDVDICKRLHLHGYKLAVDPNTFIIHNAQRDSHKKINYFFWHIRSMIRYLWRYK
jgi:GT2 family glycosyltransferase